METKADQVLLRSVEIARRRVAGDTWPTITAWLQSEGIQVTDSQVRVYWCRRHGDAPPAVIVAEAEAAAWAERCRALTKLVDDLQLRLIAAESETAEMRARLQRAGCTERQSDRPSLEAMAAPAEKEQGLPDKEVEEAPLSQQRSLGGFQTRTANCADESTSRNAGDATELSKAQAPRRELTGFKKRPSSMGLLPRKE